MNSLFLLLGLLCANLISLLWVTVTWSQGVSLQTVPAEIADLCRILGPQIINKGDPSVVGAGVTTDFVGMPRPSGGGVDIGALECDSASLFPVAQLPPPTNFRADPMAPQSCVQLSWSYPSGMQDLLMFQIYLRPEGGSYAWDAPITGISARPNLQTSVRCVDIPVSSSGPWYAVVKATAIDLSQSAPSNEIQIIFGGSPPLPIPKPPPTPIPPVVKLPPVWDQPKTPSKPLVMPPAPPGSGGWLTETCIWRGTCGH